MIGYQQEDGGMVVIETPTSTTATVYDFVNGTPPPGDLRETRPLNDRDRQAIADHEAERAAFAAWEAAQAAIPVDPLHAVVHAIAAIAEADPTIAALPEVADVVTIAGEQIT